MWVCLNDSFFSIVSKDCDRHEVLVRARRPGDIEKVFGRRVRVTTLHKADYLYRAVISREEVKAALARELDRVTYPNFKSSVADGPLHQAYNGVWMEMAALQPTKPYSGGFKVLLPEDRTMFDETTAGTAAAANKTPAKKKRRK